MGYEFARHGDYTFLIETNGTIISCIDKNEKVVYSGTNATTVIQWAMDELTTLYGGTIFLKAGLYEINDTLDFGKRCRLIGESVGSTSGTTLGTCIKLADNTNKDMINYPLGKTFGEIAYIFFDGNQTNQTSNGSAIVIDGGIDIWIHHNFFRYVNDYTIQIVPTAGQDCWNVWISNNCMENGTNGGIRVDHELGLVKRSYIVNNHFHGGGEKIYLYCATAANRDNIESLLINGNTFSSTAYIHVERSSNVIITSNGIIDTSSPTLGGVYVKGSHNCIISDNHCYSCNVGFVVSDYTEECIFSNNMAHDCTTPQIITATGASDNDFINNKNWAIPADGGGTRQTINGLGYNAGNPGAAGNWNGNGIEGIRVRDTTNNKTYIYASGGWREISAT